MLSTVMSGSNKNLHTCANIGSAKFFKYRQSRGTNEHFKEKHVRIMLVTQKKTPKFTVFLHFRNREFEDEDIRATADTYIDGLVNLGEVLDAKLEDAKKEKTG